MESARGGTDRSSATRSRLRWCVSRPLTFVHLPSHATRPQFTAHLRQVNKVCAAHGLQPMIWSDMLFCLPAKNNALSGYYDPNSVVTAELADSIPNNVQTVFWECVRRRLLLSRQNGD